MLLNFKQLFMLNKDGESNNSLTSSSSLWPNKNFSTYEEALKYCEAGTKGGLRISDPIKL